MSNDLHIPEISITTTAHGVIDLTPPFVQPVNVVNLVSVVQPIAITGALTDAELRATPVPVSGTFIFSPALTATTVAISVGASPTVLLGTNVLRKGLAIQGTTDIVFVRLSSTASTSLYSYELPKKGILEIEGYCGPVTAITATGSVIVMVTEKI